MASISDAIQGLFGQFIVQETYVLQNTLVSQVTLCGVNPLRWALLISASKAGTGLPYDVFISTINGSAQQGKGWQLDAGTPNIDWNFRQYGALVQQQWYGGSATTSAAITWTVIEVLIQQ